MHASFRKVRYIPHGFYLPKDADMATLIRDEYINIHKEEDVSKKYRALLDFQDKCEELERKKVKGKWTGQQAIHRSKARFKVVGGGRDGGKTFLCAHELFADCDNRPYGNYYIIGPSIKQMSRCWDTFCSIIDNNGIKLKEHRRSEYRLVLYNDAIIEGLTAEEPKQARGARINKAILDEASQYDPSYWEESVRPTLSGVNGSAIFISTFSGYNAYYDLFTNASRRTKGYENWEAFKFASWENAYHYPQGANSPEILEVKALLPAQTFYEEYGAIAKRPQHIVFAEFIRPVHMKDCPYNPDMPVYLAIDPANPNPYAVAVIQDYGDYIWGIDCIYMRNAIFDQVYAIAKDRPWWNNVVDAVIDSSSPSEATLWRTKAGISVRPVNKNSAIDFVAAVRDHHITWLRNPAVYSQVLDERFKTYCESRGISVDSIPYEQRIRIQEDLSFSEDEEENLTLYRRCARLFIDQSHCGPWAQEYQSFTYGKPKRGLVDVQNPGKSHNHLMDAVSYWLWVYKHYAEQPTPDRYVNWN